MSQLSFQLIYKAVFPSRAAHLAPPPRSSYAGCDVAFVVCDVEPSGDCSGSGDDGEVRLCLIVSRRDAGGAYGETVNHAGSVCFP